jgi:hypothetical protein
MNDPRSLANFSILYANYKRAARERPGLHLVDLANEALNPD